MINKKKLIEEICTALEKDLVVLKEAALETYKAATNEESKAENEYDTRGLEASYLAGAQAKRVAEIEEQLSIFKYLEIKEFTKDSALGSTAIAKLDHDGKTVWVFLLPKGGGMHFEFDNKTIQVVTPTSPLGEALVGLKIDDEAVVEKGAMSTIYTVLDIC